MEQNLSQRKQIRLKEYDYSQEGYYFITICTQNRKHILSHIETINKSVGVDAHIDPKMNKDKEFIKNNVGAGPVSARKNKTKENVKLTQLGEIVENVYLNLGKEFKYIKTHEYVIMPNHIHCIIEILRADTGPAPTIGDIICSLKTRITGYVLKGIKKGIYKPFNKRLFQRNYYEHVIRNEKEYYAIIEYIQNNPANWEQDKYYN